MYPATRVACAGIRTGAAAFAGTEAGMACKSLSARAISLGRRAFSSATAVQEVAEGRLTTSMATKTTTNSWIELSHATRIEGIGEGLESSSCGYSTSWRGSKSCQFQSTIFQQTRNAAARIEGRPYSGHSIDQMQNRGIPFSAVENTISSGRAISSKNDVTKCIYYDHSNDMSVVVNSKNGNVITVSHGELK